MFAEVKHQWKPYRIFLRVRTKSGVFTPFLLFREYSVYKLSRSRNESDECYRFYTVRIFVNYRRFCVLVKTTREVTGKSRH